jgi:hypothetical protein
VICDQRVMLNGYYSARKYPEHLRRIRFKDPESGKTLVFLTQQHDAAGADDCRAVQKSMEGRVVLQVDQAAPCASRHSWAPARTP